MPGFSFGVPDNTTARIFGACGRSYPPQVREFGNPCSLRVPCLYVPTYLWNPPRPLLTYFFPLPKEGCLVETGVVVSQRGPPHKCGVCVGCGASVHMYIQLPYSTIHANALLSHHPLPTSPHHPCSLRYTPPTSARLAAYHARLHSGGIGDPGGQRQDTPRAKGSHVCTTH